jgi:hypothetical protein
MPSGFGAKFAAASEKRIDPKSMTITAEDATIMEKAGIEHLSGSSGFARYQPYNAAADDR